MKLKAAILMVLSCLAQTAVADDQKEKTAFEQALESRTDISTKESIVLLNGQKFRKIEYGTESYYLQLLQEETDTSKLVALCGDPAAARFIGSPISQITASVRVMKRPRIFIEALAQACSKDPLRPILVVSPALRIGFAIDDEPGSKALIQNKQIYLSPGGLGFSGTW